MNNDKDLSGFISCQVSKVNTNAVRETQRFCLADFGTRFERRISCLVNFPFLNVGKRTLRLQVCRAHMLENSKDLQMEYSGILHLIK